jgi:hypothetical protein
MADAKKHALETGRTLTALIQDAVVALIQRERGAQSPRVLNFPVYGGSGLEPGVDISSTAKIYETLDRLDGPKGT